MSLEIYEDGKKIPEDRVLELDSVPKTMPRNAQFVVIKPKQRLTGEEEQKSIEAFKKFSTGIASWLVLPHGWKFLAILPEEE